MSLSTPSQSGKVSLIPLAGPNPSLAHLMSPRWQASGASGGREAGQDRARRKIWQLEDYQCAVVGTCLSLGELRRLARKTGLALPPGGEEYEVHSRCVTMCKVRNDFSEALNKFLDKKHQKQVWRAGKARDVAELSAGWDEALAQGDVPGGFWALLTHPLADPDLMHHAFGQVHMLSHLVGASNRNDIRRLRELERGRAELEQALEASRCRLRALTAQGRAREKSLAAQVEELRHRNDLLARQVESLGAAREGRGAQADLRRELAQAQRERDEAREEARRQRGEARRLGRLVAVLTRKGRARFGPLAEGETRPEAGGGQVAACLVELGVCPGDCPGGLCGKRVLYVGGRANLVPHYRALVERAGGRFRHHDGGQECRRCALDQCLAGADLVFCPVDCVSHDACQRVKRACKGATTTFVPLRCSGLSSLAAVLRAVGEGQAEAGGGRREMRA